jgi:periplasmic copper chaperone A
MTAALSPAIRAVFTALAAVLVACSSDEGSWRSANGEIAVSRVAAPAPANVGSPDSATMAVYATIANTSATDDTLLSITAPDARSATLHSTMDHGGTRMMMPAQFVVVPAHGITRLAPGGTHVMLEGLARRFAPGDTLALAFVFRRGGSTTVNASVFSYEQIEKALQP